MNTQSPQTISDYLNLLKAALADADPALIRDALYDAEEYLRAEFAANPNTSEPELLAQIASSYGAPEEVADIYRQTEITVQKAILPPVKTKSSSPIKHFFSVALDPYTYGALFYMLLSIATGIFYFTWAVSGLSLSTGLMVLIIGIPFFIVFIASVHAISLLEGRLIEVLLGERMPRRPLYPSTQSTWGARIKALFTDARTWLSLLYMVLMMPFGILYFTLVVTLLVLSAGLIVAPVIWWLSKFGLMTIHGGAHIEMGELDPNLFSPFIFIAGIILLFSSLHLFRAIGKLHARFAKHVLVES